MSRLAVKPTAAATLGDSYKRETVLRRRTSSLPAGSFVIREMAI
jgi:hypothetical protein